MRMFPHTLIVFTDQVIAFPFVVLHYEFVEQVNVGTSLKILVQAVVNLSPAECMATASKLRSHLSQKSGV